MSRKVGKSKTVHNLLFCLAHTLCTSYVTNTFLLVISSVRSKQLLCFLHGQGQKSEQKLTTKNLVGFHNHSPLLTMMIMKIIYFTDRFLLRKQGHLTFTAVVNEGHFNFAKYKIGLEKLNFCEYQILPWEGIQRQMSNII